MMIVEGALECSRAKESEELQRVLGIVAVFIVGGECDRLCVRVCVRVWVGGWVNSRQTSVGVAGSINLKDLVSVGRTRELVHTVAPENVCACDVLGDKLDPGPGSSGVLTQKVSVFVAEVSEVVVPVGHSCGSSQARVVVSCVFPSFFLCGCLGRFSEDVHVLGLVAKASDNTHTHTHKYHCVARDIELTWGLQVRAFSRRQGGSAAAQR